MSILQGTSRPDSLQQRHSEHPGSSLPPECLLLVWKVWVEPHDHHSTRVQKRIQEDTQGIAPLPPGMLSLALPLSLPLQDSDTPEPCDPVRPDLSLSRVSHSGPNAEIHWLGPQ